MAIDLISTHIQKQLKERSHNLRGKIAVPHRYISSPSGASSPENILDSELDLDIMKSTPQLSVIFIILRIPASTDWNFYVAGHLYHSTRSNDEKTGFHFLHRSAVNSTSGICLEIFTFCSSIRHHSSWSRNPWQETGYSGIYLLTQSYRKVAYQGSLYAVFLSCART